jgi:hypothetical protein
MAVVPVRAQPQSVGERGFFARQAKQRCCRPEERYDDHRFAGLLPVALIRDAAPDRAARGASVSRRAAASA